MLISKLADRVREDIAMVCRDTCALESGEYALPNLGMTQNPYAIRAPPQDFPRQPVTYSPPECIRPCTPKKHGTFTKDSGSYHPSTPQPRTPRNNERCSVQEDMDFSPPSTPSLVDGDLETPRHSVLITPHGRGHGMPEFPGYGPQIVDDDVGVHSPIIRDFAHLSPSPHGEPIPKEYYSERMVPISKADRRFGGPLVPDTPTRARNIVVVSEFENEDLRHTPSKATTSPKEDVAEEKELDLGDKIQEPTTDGADEVDIKPRHFKEPVLEGWLKYRCEPLDPQEPTPSEQLPFSKPGQASSESDAAPEPAPGSSPEYLVPLLEPLNQGAGFSS